MKKKQLKDSSKTKIQSTDLLCQHPKFDFYKTCGLYNTEYCILRCPSSNK